MASQGAPMPALPPSGLDTPGGSEEQTASASADATTHTDERMAKAGKKGNSEARQGGKQLSGTEGVDARLNAALRRDKALAGWPMS